MCKIDLKAVTSHTLELMAEGGISQKKLSEYKGSGFAVILEHFEIRGISIVTQEMLDCFILEQRDALNKNEISTWKWELIRRSCELLKFCASHDTVNLPRLDKWDTGANIIPKNFWTSTPDEVQLKDNENIFSLVWRTWKALNKSGLSEVTIYSYRSDGLEMILTIHHDAEKKRYTPVLIEDEISRKRNQYEDNLISRAKYQNFRKAAYLLKEMHDTGQISLKKLPIWNLREPNTEFKHLLDEYVINAKKTGKLSERSISIIRQVIRRFMFLLEDCGYKSLEQLSHTVVNSCTTEFLKRYSGNLYNAIYPLKKFLTFLFENQFTKKNLSISLPESATKKKSFHEGFTKEELLRILEQPNTATALGKRDYAIMILVTQTGLRGCDIVNLKFEDIDWRKREIRIVQHKTGKPLALPLEPESGNAIAEYILHGRPGSNLPYIFLCHTGTHRPIKSRSAGTIVSRYMKKAGIESNRRAIHAMRKTFGTMFLQNDVPLDLIQQLLGHSRLDSAKSYLSIDEHGLKRCALPLLHTKKGGDEE